MSGQIKIDPDATLLKRISGSPHFPEVYLMGDGTFRSYTQAGSPRCDRKHFVAGYSAGKDERTIIAEAADLLCGSGTIFYHEDGSVHGA